MNTETGQDKFVTETTGTRLRQAREALGLTEQVVAERLCLKVCIIRDIEEDKMQESLASTFQRGYIRSYAKLVHIPEDELLPSPKQDIPIEIMRSPSMQNFSLGKKRQKRDGWLMGFTWLIILVVLGLTGAWWWQNYQIHQEEIAKMANQSPTSLLQGEEPALPQRESDNLTDKQKNAKRWSADNANEEVFTSPQSALNSAVILTNTDNSTASSQDMIPSTPKALDSGPTDNALIQASVSNTNADAALDDALPPTNDLTMNFSANCWLQIIDGSGKKLFSGMQKKNATLNVVGKSPYKLIIGVPSAVTVVYQGKPVDLTRFIKTDRVARFTLGEE